MTKTELVLEDFKKKLRVVQNQIADIEQDHLFTYLPMEVKDSTLEALMSLEGTLTDGIVRLEEMVQLMKVNEGLGL